MVYDELLQAKDKFLKDYSTKISYLGCTLAAVIGKRREGSKFIDSIEARVQSEENIPKNMKKQIEDIIPKTYLYWEKKIPVKLSYMSIPKTY